MSDKNTIEQELLEATGQKGKSKKETPEDYLVRISTAVSELGDPEYETLSEQAQAWFTQAAAALNEDPPAPENIQSFSEFDEAAEIQEEEAAVEEEVKEEPAAPEPKKKAMAKLAKKESAKSEPKTSAAEKSKKGKLIKTGVKREGSVADTIRMLLCENPDATKEEIGKELKAKKMSFDPVRLTHIYSTTARVIEILRDLKKL